MTTSHLKPRHRSAIYMLGHALTLHTDVEIWRGLVPVLRSRLSPFERGCLAAMALEAAEDEEVFKLLETVALRRFAGTPLPALFDTDAEARWWADRASLPELKAWLAACFLRLSAREKSGFLAAARRRVAA